MRARFHGVGAIVLAHLLANLGDAFGAFRIGQELLEAGTAAIFKSHVVASLSLSRRSSQVLPVSISIR